MEESRQILRVKKDIRKVMKELTCIELLSISSFIGFDRPGRELTLRTRILNLLSSSDSGLKNKLKMKIEQVYNMRTSNTSHIEISDEQNEPPSSHPPENSDGSTLVSTIKISNFISLNKYEAIEKIPFHRILRKVAIQRYLAFDQTVKSLSYFSLTHNVRNAVFHSWNDLTEEYKIQIILVLQLDQKHKKIENKRLPHNLSVILNNKTCDLPEVNKPADPRNLPWRCNLPIDLTGEINLISGEINRLYTGWSKEPFEYTGVIYVTEKLTVNDLIVHLKKKPLRPSYKTRELIEESLRQEAGGVGICVDSIVISIQDPLGKMRIELPVRGVQCIHLQCFDAVQFLKMNEKKGMWPCPICNKAVTFSEMEVDEFFLNILRSSDLSDKCESVILYERGVWLDSSRRFQNNPKIRNNRSAMPIEEITLSDSDEDDIQPKKKR